MLLDALRTNTRPAHERLEARLSILRPDLTLAQYTDLLRRQYLLYLPLEAQVGRAIPAHWLALLDWPERRKTHLLGADLQALGERWPDAGASAETVRPALPDEAAAWGALYVLEGATLGGQVICRHLGPHLGLQPGAGLSFYASYGALVGPRWKAFLALLERRHEAAGPQAATFRAGAVQGACDTFAAFERWVVPALGPQRVVA
ncbi:biliverdin-producing heme oxygenase [Deinococcus koreensis]|uniref:Heme oxygenase n=1 Tax=Deinococcus koreensis TaxID=2054903 RepID=A0A2K3USH7_9DEIO|nr:biliverdin-producing heme oxygenase [Deinococcus koreensis]PNY79478.1 hypothetical protein CVO96_18780 [Deinococcus koreensis]